MLSEEAIREKVELAGRKALEYKDKGFHCSESVFLAINEVLQITDPRMVKAITGFHGGGGSHRLDPNVDMTKLLAGVAAGYQEVGDDGVPIVQVRHLCGALAACIMCTSLLYGRTSPDDDLTCVDELCYELHRRFQEELGHNECKFLREIWVPKTPDGSCSHIYRTGAQIGVDVILHAPQLVRECRPRHEIAPESIPCAARDAVPGR
ncbi:MAG: C-GCAxxG-C-C family protein [Anaerolineae bacterium]